MKIKEIKNGTEIKISNMRILIINKTKGSFKPLPQLQLEDEDGFDCGFVDLTDELIDALCETLQKAKNS